MSNSFEALGLSSVLLQTLEELGYETPTPIQSSAIPRLLNGEDIIGQAKTGTGKTAAFTLPMLERHDNSPIYGLILTPTRELAIQVAEAVHRYGAKLGVRVLPIYGGQPYSRQIRRLEKGVHVVVGTPGRILDLMRQNALDLSTVRYLVLDEADEMLRMSFIDDVEVILAATDAHKRQTAIFSATMPEPIKRLAKKYMHNPSVVAITSDEMTVENIEQRYYIVREADKVPALCRLLEVEDLQNTVIFTRTKAGSAELAETLVARGYRAEAIHGDLPQVERERILRRFRNRNITILVATDVVARGVDIPEVSHVINFDIPQLPIEYVHRIGRTGRAGRAGTAILLISPKQRRNLRMIEQFTNKRIQRGKLPTREEVLRARNLQFRQEMLAYLSQVEHLEDDGLLEDLIALGYSAETVALAAMQALRLHEDQRPLEEIRDVKEREHDTVVRMPRKGGRKRSARYERDEDGREAGMVSLKVDVGRREDVRPADVVYGIANHGDIPGRVLGAIRILNYETFVDVPQEYAEAVLNSGRSTRIKGKQIQVQLADKRSPSRGNSRQNESQHGHKKTRKKKSQKRRLLT
ncbi:MAG: RNA helicase [Phototrophicales bacterium]|nr:MAG: RNA helicase [Phototrophicales bacterium]